MLDGRVLGASQVEYKPFGKPPLKRECGRPTVLLSTDFKIQERPSSGLPCCPGRVLQPRAPFRKVPWCSATPRSHAQSRLEVWRSTTSPCAFTKLGDNVAVLARSSCVVPGGSLCGQRATLQALCGHSKKTLQRRNLESPWPPASWSLVPPWFLRRRRAQRPARRTLCTSAWTCPNLPKVFNSQNHA